MESLGGLLEAPWGHLGTILEAFSVKTDFGIVLGRSLVPLGWLLGGFGEDLGRIWGGFGKVLGQFGSGFGKVWGRFFVSFSM